MHKMKESFSDQTSQKYSCWYKVWGGSACHGQVRPDGFVLGKREQRCDDGAAGAGPILWRGTGWHMDMNGGITEELGGHAKLGSIAARKGVRNVGTLLHDIP